MNKKICGTYWLVATTSGAKYITQGSKPKRMPGNFWKIDSKNTPWMYVGGGDPLLLRMYYYSNTIHGDSVESSDYIGLNFPDITNSDEPIEIEIGKSGKIYTYES